MSKKVVRRGDSRIARGFCLAKSVAVRRKFCYFPLEKLKNYVFRRAILESPLQVLLKMRFFDNLTGLEAGRLFFTDENVGEFGFEAVCQVQVPEEGNDALRGVGIDTQTPGAHVQSLALVFVQGEDEPSPGTEEGGQKR